MPSWSCASYVWYVQYKPREVTSKTFILLLLVKKKVH